MQTPWVNKGDSGTAAWADSLHDDAYAASVLRAHQETTPGMALYVENGAYYVNGVRYFFAGGSTPTFTAPVSNPRIDVLSIDATGTLNITQGTEAASPTVPTYPENQIALCEVYHVVGETAIYTSNNSNYGWTSAQGYIQNDVRPAMSYGPNFAAIGEDLLPDTTDTRSLGSSGNQWKAIYGESVYANGRIVAGSKFGGTGSDGALNITSGTTTINLGGANIFIKNYTSITIDAGATVNFTNPAASGTLIIFKSQGDVNIAGTLDASGMGSTGGVAGASGSGAGGPGTTPFAPFGAANNTSQYNYPNLYQTQTFKFLVLAPGAGGSGSNGTQSVGGAQGGAGGGTLYIECAGTYTATGILKSLGIQGSQGVSPGASGAASGGGGSGASGDIYVIYNLLGSDTATYSAESVPGGAGVSAGSIDGGNGGNSGANAHYGSNSGALGGGIYSGAGGAGPAGSVVRELNVTWP